MARRNMKSALGASMRAEADAVRDRFEVAESVMAGRQPSAAPQQSARQQSPLRQSAPPAPTQSLTKVVRDSFTMPVGDYELITAIRARCLKQGMSATKAEVLRAGLAALSALPGEELLEVMKALPKVKTGRPAVSVDTI
jgi:hypothetical protein